MNYLEKSIMKGFSKMHNSGSELERKYKITKDQFKKIIKASFPEASYKIFQGYFNTEDPRKEYRIRSQESAYLGMIPDAVNKYTLTIKDKDKVGWRSEYEICLSVDGAKDIIKHCSKFIEKTRYLIQWNDLYLEVDMYNDDLIIVEIEFESVEKFQSYIPTFEFEEEVTCNKQFYNSNLASNTMPTEWIEKKIEKYFK